MPLQHVGPLPLLLRDCAGGRHVLRVSCKALRHVRGWPRLQGLLHVHVERGPAPAQEQERERVQVHETLAGAGQPLPQVLLVWEQT